VINAVSHTMLWVTDQDEALRFYTEVLGFEVRKDIAMGEGGPRWLTVGPKGQPDLEIILGLPAAPMVDPDSATQIRALLNKGALCGGVMRTDDTHGTYKELSAKGVEFIQPPAERPYGIEAVFRDNSGNWFSLTQPM
jgi:catechol 2,3-dioxygenase-like lactoylglutathione lyase family enzyme